MPIKTSYERKEEKKCEEKKTTPFSLGTKDSDPIPEKTVVNFTSKMKKEQAKPTTNFRRVS